MILLDTHTHHLPPYPIGIVDASAHLPEVEQTPMQLYSVGLHPWHLSEELSPALSQIERLATLPQVVAIGEAGLDTICDTPMWLQIQAFERQALLAQTLGKPLIVHCVRTASEIAQLRKSYRATVPWIIHGFRGKPSLLRILLQAGCYISYGEHFNADSLRLTPPERLLAETDESTMPIEQIIAAIATTRSEPDISGIIANNTSVLFSHPNT